MKLDTSPFATLPPSETRDEIIFYNIVPNVKHKDDSFINAVPSEDDHQSQIFDSGGKLLEQHITTKDLNSSNYIDLEFQIEKGKYDQLERSSSLGDVTNCYGWTNDSFELDNNVQKLWGSDSLEKHVTFQCEEIEQMINSKISCFIRNIQECENVSRKSLDLLKKSNLSVISEPRETHNRVCLTCDISDEVSDSNSLLTFNVAFREKVSSILSFGSELLCSLSNCEPFSQCDPNDNQSQNTNSSYPSTISSSSLSSSSVSSPSLSSLRLPSTSPLSFIVPLNNISQTPREIYTSLSPQPHSESSSLHPHYLNIVQCTVPSYIYLHPQNHINFTDIYGSNYSNSSVGSYGNLTWSSDVDLAPKYDLSFLFLVIFIAAGGIGNILVCMAICLERRLHNVTNYFLMSLAVADLLVSLVVMPFGAIVGFLGYWPFGVVWCNIYVTCDVLACTSSIMHMCTISLGRYLGIRNPIKTRRTSKKTVGMKVVMVWLIAMLVTSFITVLGMVDVRNIMPVDNLCAINNQTFFIIGSLCAFYIPMVIMVVSYALTFHLLRKKAKFACDTEGSGIAKTMGRYRSVRRKPPSQGSTYSYQPRLRRMQSVDESIREHNVNANQETHQCVRRSSWSPICRTDSSNSRISTHRRISYRSNSYSNGHASGHYECSSFHKCEQGTQTPESIASETKNFKLKALRLQLIGTASWHQRFLPTRKRDSLAANAVANEQKASKVLGLVFFAFVICWTPFFILNIYMAACPICQVPDIVINVCLWLGYVSSTINPIIYTIFNKTFKAAFIKILKCDYNFDQRHIRSHSMSDNMVPTYGGSGLTSAAQTPCSIRTLSTYVKSPSYQQSLTTPELEEEQAC